MQDANYTKEMKSERVKTERLLAVAMSRSRKEKGGITLETMAEIIKDGVGDDLPFLVKELKKKS